MTERDRSCQYFSVTVRMSPSEHSSTTGFFRLGSVCFRKAGGLDMYKDKPGRVNDGSRRPLLKLKVKEGREASEIMQLTSNLNCVDLSEKIDQIRTEVGPRLCPKVQEYMRCSSTPLILVAAKVKNKVEEVLRGPKRAVNELTRPVET